MESHTAGYSQPIASGWTPPAPEQLASLFPDLDILELLGRGGMGAVYKARQRDLDRLVALKILPPSIGASAGFTDRFTREARALAKLNHPNIVTIYEFGQRSGEGRAAGTEQPGAPAAPIYYFLMEYVDGVTLRQLMSASRVEPREALAIVPQVCDALQYAHDHGIVHRDIKPENILLDRRGRLKVADFGLAKLTQDGPDLLTPDLSPQDALDLTAAGKTVGTPRYMAPEQVAHPQHVDHRADIYALGVVFYQMLTGQFPATPLQAPSTKVVIDVRLDQVVLRALETSPDLRYQQASEFKNSVEAFSSIPPAAPPSTPQSPLRSSDAYVSTPEYLATLAGSFKLVEARGELALFSDRLLFTSGWRRFDIPLTCIRALKLVTYPFLVSPNGLRSISIEYEESGQTRRVFFTPRSSGFAVIWDTNRRVAEWFVAIQQAANLPASPGLSRVTYREFSPLGRFVSAGLFLSMGLLVALPFVLQLTLLRRLNGATFVSSLPMLAFPIAFVAVMAAGLALIRYRSTKRWIGPALIFVIPILLIISTGVLFVSALIKSNTDVHDARVMWGESAGSAAAIHIIDVSAAGRVVTLSIVSDAGFPAHDLVVTYTGMYSVPPLPSEIPAGLVGMLAPTSNIPGVDRAGQTIEGANTVHGPGTFRFGFLLPDEVTAAGAADMVRRLYAGKTSRLDLNRPLGLFRLESSSMGMHGQPGNIFAAQLILLPPAGAAPRSNR